MKLINNFRLQILWILLFLTSCDCGRHITATVVDKTTGLPIKNASVYLLNSKSTTNTDSNGNFIFWVIESGFQCFCKTKKEVAITKENYQSQTVPAKTRKIELQSLSSLATAVVSLTDLELVKSKLTGVWVSRLDDADSTKHFITYSFDKGTNTGWTSNSPGVESSAPTFTLMRKDGKTIMHYYGDIDIEIIELTDKILKTKEGDGPVFVRRRE